MAASRPLVRRRRTAPCTDDQTRERRTVRASCVVGRSLSDTIFCRELSLFWRRLPGNHAQLEAPRPFSKTFLSRCLGYRRHHCPPGLARPR